MPSALIVLVDNRLFDFESLELQSALLSHHKNVRTTLGKYLTLASAHCWMKPMQAVLCAQSADKTRLAVRPSLEQVSALLEPVHTCSVQPVLIPVTTWSSYIVDGLMKILNYIHHEARKPTDKYSILIYSTDAAMIGNSQSRSLSEGLRRAFPCLRDLSKLAEVEVRIVCTIIGDPTESTAPEAAGNMHELLVERERSGMGARVTVHKQLNTSLHFEEELRSLVAASVSPMPMTVVFPAVLDAQCSCKMDIIGTTLEGCDAMHDGLADPEIWSLVPRGEIDPLHMRGSGLLVRCSATDSKNRVHQSQVFQAVAGILAQTNCQIVLKVRHRESQSDQYWVLVPPAASDVKLTKDNAHLVLLRLADRDSVVLDLPSEETATAALKNDNASQDSIEEMDEAAQGTSEWDKEEVLRETREYLERALFDGLSAPQRYNPLSCHSGVIKHQNQFDQLMLSSATRGKMAQRAAPLPAVSPADGRTAAVTPKKLASRKVRRKKDDSFLFDLCDEADEVMLTPPMPPPSPRKPRASQPSALSTSSTCQDRKSPASSGVKSVGEDGSSKFIAATPQAVEAVSPELRTALTPQQEEEMEAAATTSLASLTSLTPYQQQLARNLLEKTAVSSLPKGPVAPPAARVLKRKLASVSHVGPAKAIANLFRN